MANARVELQGSDRRASGDVGSAVPADERAQVTLVLRRRSGEETPAAHRPGAPDAPMTSQGLGEQYGASSEDLAAVTSYLRGKGLDVLDEDGPSRRVRVEGTVGTLSEIFGTSLRRVTRADDRPQSRMRDGMLSLPAELVDRVTAVLGLDDRPQAFSRLVRPAPAVAQQVSYTPLQLAEIYALPESDGAGQTVAVIELGGGFTQADLDAYFTSLDLAGPTVTAVGVDGGSNQPGGADGADAEVLLDVEIIGALVPKADLVVYFAPNTDAGFLDAISTAAHAQPTPAAMSISWGQSEDEWTSQARGAMDDAIADAVAMGITVTAAAGDNGSGDSAASGVHADFPASSPHALGCGGTNLVVDAGGQITETVWNGGSKGGATGGGVSDAFALPSWQAGVGIPVRSGTRKQGRGVPDVAANADPATGYQVLVDGKATVVGGTSAVAPLWAALVTRLVASGGTSLGLLQPTLYAGASAGKPSPALRDVVTGDNGAYAAGPGWDACTGLGVPDSRTASALTA